MLATVKPTEPSTISMSSLVMLMRLMIVKPRTTYCKKEFFCYGDEVDDCEADWTAIQFEEE